MRPQVQAKTENDQSCKGRVIKLDRGFPLVELDDGTTVRAEHDVAFAKDINQKFKGVVVGDEVIVRRPDQHDKAIISSIFPRKRVLVRRDPAEVAEEQVLAANFDWVFIAEPMSDLNFHRLERELVIAHLTGASIAVLLTKADLVDVETQDKIEKRVRELAGDEITLFTLQERGSEDKLNKLRTMLSGGFSAVLIGKSGVGKSSLVNRLVGSERQKIGEVRDRDGKGRHTTVSREMVPLPDGGWVTDMPGIRGLGLWQAHQGIESAFSDITTLASSCRFRDCQHQNEPDCAVLAAVKEGKLSPLRLRSYQALLGETKRNEEKARQQNWSRRR